MKSIFTKLIALVLALASIFALASCGYGYTTYYYDPVTGQWSDKQPSGSNNNGGNSGSGNNGGGNGGSNGGSYDDGSLSVEISGISQTIRYIDDDGMIIPVNNSDLSIDKNYTLELTFTITPNRDSDGYSYFSTVLTFTDISILNGTIKEAETGKQIENTVINAETGTERKDISLSFKIPAEKDTEKQITIVIGLEPLNVTSDSEMQVGFSSDDAKIAGSDGISRSFAIAAATLARPVISYDRADMQIKWRHVKNATYYVVFAEGVNTGIMVQAAGETAGTELVLDVIENYEKLYGKSITVQAFSDVAHFLASDKSEAVVAR